MAEAYYEEVTKGEPETSRVLDTTDPEVAEMLFRKEVRDRCKDKCGNCGNPGGSLAVVLVVPEAAGGLRTPDNATLLCRTCGFAKTLTSQKTGSRIPIDFLTSRNLHTYLSKESGYSSASACVRELVDLFLSAPEMFPDLERFQDGDSEVKVNVWMEAGAYARLQAAAAALQTTMTDVVKSLILCHAEEKAKE